MNPAVRALRRVLAALVVAAGLGLGGAAAGYADAADPPAEPGEGWTLRSSDVVEDTLGARRCEGARQWTWDRAEGRAGADDPAGTISLLTVRCEDRYAADGMYAWLRPGGRVVADASEFGESVLADSQRLTRAWTALGDGDGPLTVVVLRTPCGTDPSSGDRTATACAQEALPLAERVAAALPGGQDEARTPGYHGRQAILTLLVPAAMVALVVLPVRSVLFLARPSYRSRSVSTRYRDVSADVLAARWRRRVRRGLVAFLLLLAFVLPPVLVARDSSTLTGLAIFALPVLVLLVVGGRTFLRPHAVERRRRRGGGQGLQAGVGVVLSILAAAAAAGALALSALAGAYAGMWSGWPRTDAAAVARLDLPLLSALMPVAQAFRDDWPAVVLAGFGAVAVLALVDALGQRLRQASVDEALAQDARPHYLYLRSFDEDRLRLPALLRSRGPLATFALLRRIRFEEVLVRQLSETGPVIAVAPPGARLPTIGAARASFGDDEWQAHVARYAASARAVVISATPGEVRAGFGWELDLVANRIPHRRVVVVLGPWRRQELQRRWRRFCEAVAHVPLLAPITMPWVPDGVHVLAHSDHQGWRAWGATRRLDWTYAVGIAEATRDYLPDWSR